MKASAFSISVGLDRTFIRRVLSAPIFVFSFLLTAFSVSAQSHECGFPFHIGQLTYNIGFDESIEVNVNNQTGKNAEWTVSPSKGVNKTKGTGNVIEGLHFNEPGIYKVTFTLPGDKGHAETSTVVVSDVNMKFDTKSVVLSKPIVKGQPSDGTILTIKATVKTTDKKNTVRYQAANLTSTGITGLTATMDKPVELGSGEHTLTFQLSGTPMYAGTAQIGFFNLLGESFFYNCLIAE